MTDSQWLRTDEAISAAVLGGTIKQLVRDVVENAVAAERERWQAESEKHQANAQHWNVKWREEKEGREQDVLDAIENERERCEGLVRRFLLFDSQRAVSWHEVQDCIAAIREGTA